MVCVKQTPDLDMILPEDWQIGAGTDEPEIGYANRVINCFDETALELALRLAEEKGGTVNALTLDDISSERMLRRLIALGVKEAIRIDCHEDTRFRAEAIASHIAAFIDEEEKPDILLAGIRSGDGNNALMPQLLAARLGWPCITDVVAIEAAGEDRLRVTRLERRVKQLLLVRTPAVIAVGNADNITLRSAILKATLEAKNAPIRVVNASADLPADKIQFRYFFRETQGRSCKMLPANDPALAADEILRVVHELERN
jgi:electron transfer flavoprotein alpha/beta subunit